MAETSFCRSYSLHDGTRVVVRSGREEDGDAIREFTRDTFPWGDYVPDAYAEWLKEPGEVLVVEAGGKPVGVTHVVYLSRDEAWFEGIRVAPEFRRKGIGRLLTRVSLELAARSGRRLARCAIDSSNHASRLMAMTAGFTLVARIAELKKVIIDDAGQADDGPSSSGERGGGSRITVAKAAVEHAEPVWSLARNHNRYLGWSFRWRLLSIDSVSDAVDSGVMLVAQDAAGRLLAGGCLSELWEENQDPAGLRIVAELNSPFGVREGLQAITEYVLRLLEEKTRGGGAVAREICIFCELDNPARGFLEDTGFRRESDDGDRVPDYDVGIWEIRLG